MTGYVLILAVSFFFTGIITRVKSILSGRKGPGIMQPMKDIARLFRKGTVYSSSTSIIFRLAPSVYLASLFMAAMVIPFGKNDAIFSFEGDFVFFAYVLAAGKFFSIIAALDTGSSFEGMGASREALFSMLAEPAFFILMGSFALLTGQISFQQIFMSLQPGSYISMLVIILAAFVMVILAMIENSRMPFDDPKTHLELTMVHEVMILDNSGFDLGLILYGTGLKFAIYGAIIADFFIGSGPWAISIILFFTVQVIFAVLAGLLESFTARFRMNHNAQFIFTLSSVSLLIFIAVLVVTGKFF